MMRNALVRLGHAVVGVDPYEVLRSNRLLNIWSWHSGALGTAFLAERHIRRSVGDQFFDLAVVDNGELLPPGAVEFLRARAGRVALFNGDNPFVGRDGRRWRTLLAALPHYDLFVTARQSTADVAPSHGARRVLRVNFFADEVLHRPAPPSEEERALYGSPVSFVGTWFPERGPFMETLLRRGVPLKIIGPRWNKAANHDAIRHAVLPGYLNPKQYSAAVRSSAIAIAMLSKGNEDLHTSRSAEIPAMGILMCAERTSEHLQMYREGEEAVFWSSADECADICLGLLADPDRIARIAEAGHKRVQTNDTWTGRTMERIVREAVETGDGVHGA
ncbi:CgeB family protein [Ancylobacter amanitiformis]|uniref:Spore protein YkvP/CgeB glycosyl transferase-like domain-containing protein n=1 Tax=Ancylobacter amanitiformis TaxID=217069 RepID=A0ABU0LS14_9HYPH|nr:glycosyltransferase [Ancylobacter amanitiformis]MDQ0511440.1 hypothetical protein [Ancylobacter amanitiformis]